MQFTDAVQSIKAIYRCPFSRPFFQMNPC